MRAHILSIGSELMLGHLTDTNATFLAQDLAAHGIELVRVTQVGDYRDRIAAAIRAALHDADVVVCSGGIGPTDDDLTREAIAGVVGQTPEVDPALLQQLCDYFASRGLTMPERNAKQAWRIPSAEILPNPVGTAPGWLVTTGQGRIVTMPGVPREMTRMWREQALPRLIGPNPDRAIRTTTLKTVGIGESATEEILDDLVKRPNPTVATYAKDDGVHVRVTAEAPTAAEADALRDETAAEVRRRLARFVYGADDTTLPQALLALLRERDLTLGVAGRGTGGRFASMIEGTPEAAGTFLGGASFAAGEQSAAELAAKAIEWFGARLGVGAVVNVAPIGPDVYAGTVTVALTGARTAEEEHAARGAFADVQRRAALTIADVLRRALTGIA